MNKSTNVIPIRAVEDWEALRLLSLPEVEARRAARCRRHRAAKWAVNAALIFAMCAASFAAGLCVGVW